MSLIGIDLNASRALAVAGARMSIFKVVESAGKYKESNAGVWSAQEIADHFESISKV